MKLVVAVLEVIGVAATISLMADVRQAKAEDTYYYRCSDPYYLCETDECRSISYIRKVGWGGYDQYCSTQGGLLPET
jgi:hypothetical protein